MKEIRVMEFNEEEYVEAREQYLGFCMGDCQDWTRDCTEPDATDYDCPVCGDNTVIGADNYLMETV